MQLPQGARLWRERGSDHAWTDETHMTAGVLDAVVWGNWQRAGGKASDKPKPIARPSDAKAAEDRRGRIEARARRARARMKQN